MSLVGTLAKIAIGVAVVKGVGGLIQSRSGGAAGGTASDGGLGGMFGDSGASGSAIPGSGSVFGGAHSPKKKTSGGLEDMMGEILGGGAGSSGGGVTGGQAADAGTSGGSIFGQGGGGLGDLLNNLGGGSTGGAAPGGTSTGGLGGALGEIIGQLGKGGATTGAATGGGGLGDLLGGLLGGALGGGLGGGLGGMLGGSDATAAKNDTNFGDLLNQSLRNGGEPEVQPTPAQDAAAGLMLRAMIMAAKSDGKIDAAEQKKLLGNLGDATPAEMDFVKQELAAPVDVRALVRQVPKGMEQHIYAMSVMAIDLDNQNEAKYLDQLAQGLGIGQADVNAIHTKLGAPNLYA